MVTGDEYLFHRNANLRQIAVEGVCKCLFSKKLCEEYQDRDHIEGVLGYLIIQLFDKGETLHNVPLVRSTITVFFQNFMCFSKYRCELFLQALIKVIYSC